jgi:hypothetical protein
MIDCIVKQLVVNGIINISVVKQVVVILARLCYTHCKGSERGEGMARHKFRHWDEKRTELLGQPELFVQKTIIYMRGYRSRRLRNVLSAQQRSLRSKIYSPKHIGN